VGKDELQALLKDEEFPIINKRGSPFRLVCYQGEIDDIAF
jgi:hypothetical protein